uniref:PLD phosphodiesterase domain-containing protein n=1 Tax=Acrobeloides nanus TaxID=290746 RepID=A0A914CJI2_9BILA
MYQNAKFKLPKPYRLVCIRPMAKHTIQIAAKDFTLLLNNKTERDRILGDDNSDLDGALVFEALINASKKGVEVNIAQRSVPGGSVDSAFLEEHGYAHTRSLNFTKFFGTGILHTKAIVVDRKHFYVGSANMVLWSLTQRRELGIAVFDCPCLGEDIAKILDIYWQIGAPDAVIPENFPDPVKSPYNENSSMTVLLNDEESLVYFAVDPRQLIAGQRQTDLNAILHIINSAKEFVHIEVMDYLPTTYYLTENYFWPIIDDALKSAAYNNHVSIKLMISKYVDTLKESYPYFHSLVALNGSLPCSNNKTKCGTIEVRFITVPPYNITIPDTRYNHAKFMVTDNTAYIGTSNWVGDYFIATAGIGMVIKSAESTAITSAIWIVIYYTAIKSKQSPTNIPVYTKPSPLCANVPKCKIQIAETLPPGMYPPDGKLSSPTTSTWLNMISQAKHTIQIAAKDFSLLLNNKTERDRILGDDNSDLDGALVFEALINASKKGVEVNIAQRSVPGGSVDSAFLEEHGYAHTRSLNFTKFFGTGILHTKAIVVDRKHFYVGSANMVLWSLTQRRELGIAVFDCPCLGEDIAKILDIYWQIGAPEAVIPKNFPDPVKSSYNENSSMTVLLNDEENLVYFAVAPRQLVAGQRQTDINAILHIINTAKEFIHIEVMYYLPTTYYMTEN